ncbi:MAG TPA: hypothetical protein VIG98_11630, partial [Bacillus sp. (in: firmicutes)]
MSNQHFLAVDIGNSWYKALAFDQSVEHEYQMPNALALFDEEYFEKPYDDDDVVLEENLIVEIK